MRLLRTLLVVFATAMSADAGELEIGLRHLASTPLANGAYRGGEVEVVQSRGFAATAEHFFTPQISAHVAATFVNPAVFLHPRGAAASTIDLNTLGMDSYSASVRYHLTSIRMIRPYAGAGVCYTVFGNLEERFGDRIELRFDPAASWLVEAGLRHNVAGGLWLDAGVAFSPVRAEAGFVRNETTIDLPRAVQVDPLTISVGAAWRFR